jgi:ATP-binding cassette subfamily B protein IrtB
MKQLISDLFELCGENSVRIRQSIIIGFIDGVFESFPFLAVYFFFHKLSLLHWKIEQLTPKDVFTVFFIFLSGVIGRWITKYIVYTLQSIASYDSVAQARLDVGDHIKQAPMGYFTETSIGNTVTTLTDDLHYIEQNAANILEKAVNGCINVVVLMIGITVFDVKIGVVFFIGSIISISIIWLMQKGSIRTATISKENQNKANNKIIEYLKGLPIYKLFPNSELSGEDMKKVFNQLRDSSYLLEKSFIRKNLLLLMFERLICGCIMIISGFMVLQKSMTMENAIVMYIAVFVIYKPLENLSAIIGMVRMMEVSLHRIKDIKQIPVINGGNLNPHHLHIKLNDVCFQYSEVSPCVINHVSLEIPEGSFTAIAGPSGCGKTTLTRLIARFWDVTSGSVKIGDVNVKDIDTERLYTYFSIVFQQVFLFNDTIENNIKLGCPGATHKEVITAAKKACCHDFIQLLPEKYNTKVGENGGNLSGGEKQRISIARAILKNAPIILLDEATSSVDPENEWMLKQAIEELIREKTVIMIAHKMKTIMNANQIIIMEKGRIHGIGTHMDLYNKDSIYTSFCNTQTAASRWKIQN